MLLLTSGIASLPPDDVAQILARVRDSHEFTEDNNPGKKHDFGSIKLNGHHEISPGSRRAFRQGQRRSNKTQFCLKYRVFLLSLFGHGKGGDMKKVVLIVVCVVLVLILSIVLTVVSAFRGLGKIQDRLELQGFARVIKDRFVSCFMLDTGDGKVALVDAGADPKARAILAELERRHLTPADVSVILLTHGHGDHISGCAMFPHAAVYAMAEDIPLTEGRARATGLLTRWFPPNKLGLKVKVALQDGDTVTLGKLKAKVYAAPGHTRGSAVFLVNGVLFMGDSAEATAKGTLAACKYIFSEDQKQGIASLKKLAAELAPIKDQVKFMAFAHSGVLEGLQPLLDFAARE